MPRLTSNNEIKQRLEEAYIPEYYEMLYRQALYTFGDSFNKAMGLRGGGARTSFPHFPDIEMRFLKAGRTRKILNVQLRNLSKMMSAEPEPIFPQVDKWTARMRQEFWRRRRAGDQYGHNPWQVVDAAVYLSGDGFGVAFQQLGLRTNRRTNRQYVVSRFSSPMHTLWDAHVCHPADATYVAFVRYLSEDQARVRFKDDVVTRYMDEHVFSSENPLRQLRIFEYFDMGWGDGEATQATIIDDIDGPITEKKASPFPCLPWAHYTSYTSPLQRRPFGRVVLQMSTQELLNIIEDRHARSLKRSPADVIDPNRLDAADVNKWLQGQGNGIIKTKGAANVGDVHARIPGAPISEADFAIAEYYERQFNDDAVTSEYEQGRMPSRDVTLGEAQILDARAQTMSGWSRKQILAYYLGSITKMFTIAAEFDRDPVDIDVFGYNMTLNSEDPKTWMDEVLAEHSEILFDEGTLDASSDAIKRQRRLSELLALQDLVIPAPVIDPLWYAEERLKAIGENNPGEALMQDLAPQGGMAEGSESLMGNVLGMNPATEAPAEAAITGPPGP